MIPLEQFRSAMRRLTATVSVISVARAGERHGMTATAVTSVSAEPPSLLVCINRRGRLYPMLDGCGRFCVNVLHAQQSEVSRIFAEAHSTERFARGDWGADDYGTPYLRDAQVAIFCRKSTVVPYGSHAVFFGDVEEVRTRADIAPLLYQNGDYGTCAPLP